MAKLTRRTRNFGWGFSTDPTGEDAYSIKTPSAPDHTGTPLSVLKARSKNPVFNNLGGAFFSERWFLAGKPIKFNDHEFSNLLDKFTDEMEVTLL